MRVVQMNPNSTKPRQNTPPPAIAQYIPQTKVKKSPMGIDIKNFKADDWILLCIILTLILEGSTDYILLIALGYLFLIGL